MSPLTVMRILYAGVSETQWFCGLERRRLRREEVPDLPLPESVSVPMLNVAFGAQRLIILLTSCVDAAWCQTFSIWSMA